MASTTHSTTKLTFFHQCSAQATKFCGDSVTGFSNQNNASGQIEALFCLCNCEVAGGAATMKGNSDKLSDLSSANGNMLARVWASSLVIPVGSGLANPPPAADITKINECLTSLREITSNSTILATLPKSLQIMAHASEAVGAVITNAPGSAEASLASANSALALMKTSPNLKPFLKESYTAVAEGERAKQVCGYIHY